MNTIIEIANAVVECLSDYSAELQYAPDYVLSKLSEQRVVVVPMAKERKIISRNSVEQSHQIEIGFLYRSKDLNLVELIGVVERIGAYFLGKRLLSETCVSVVHEPIYSADDLRGKNQFTSVIALTFKEVGS